MEYIFLSAGLLYMVKKKKFPKKQINKEQKIKPRFDFFRNYLKSSDIYRYIQQKLRLKNEIRQNQIKILNDSYSNSINIIREEQKYNETLNRRIRMIDFHSFSDLHHINVETDADIYGGDTQADLDYNLMDETLVISGNFEMKNKHLIEIDYMYAKFYFFNLKEKNKFFNDVNLIRICINTYGNVVKFTLQEKVPFAGLSLFKGYILDDSKELHVYEIPLQNLKLDNEYHKKGSHLTRDIFLHCIFLQIESKKEGPFKVELKWVDFVSDHRVEKYYSKHLQPIFLKIEN